MGTRDAESEEEYEVLDAVSMNENWLSKTLGDVSGYSAAKQFGVGSVTGIVSGWLFVKVGKVAAATIGTTVLIIQIAQHQGYIEINWDRVRSNMRTAERQMRRSAGNYSGVMNNMKTFIQENLFLAVGFGGGFLIGQSEYRD